MTFSFIGNHVEEQHQFLSSSSDIERLYDKGVREIQSNCSMKEGFRAVVRVYMAAFSLQNIFFSRKVMFDVLQERDGKESQV